MGLAGGDGERAAYPLSWSALNWYGRTQALTATRKTAFRRAAQPDQRLAFNIEAHETRAVRCAALVMLDGDHVGARREPHVAAKGGYRDFISDDRFEFR
jgi:hypothetical protein